MAAIARTVADSGGNSARTADHTVDRSAADCARGCGHRVGGFRHSVTGSLENVHLFTPMGTGNIAWYWRQGHGTAMRLTLYLVIR
jgi:hypothetical protein